MNKHSFFPNILAIRICRFLCNDAINAKKNEKRKKETGHRAPSCGYLQNAKVDISDLLLWTYFSGVFFVLFFFSV